MFQFLVSYFVLFCFCFMVICLFLCSEFVLILFLFVQYSKFFFLASCMSFFRLTGKLIIFSTTTKKNLKAKSQFSRTFILNLARFYHNIIRQQTKSICAFEFQSVEKCFTLRACVISSFIMSSYTVNSQLVWEFVVEFLNLGTSHVIPCTDFK